MKVRISGLLATVALFGASGCQTATVASNVGEPAEATVPVAMPTDNNVLFWTRDQRDTAFARMEKIGPSRTIEAGDHARSLTMGAPLPPLTGDMNGPTNIREYMAAQRLAGLIVLHDGKVRFEDYGIGFGPEQRWTSFSVAKSLVSTLVGAAVADGSIASLDDPLTRYIPELVGSGYDGVTVRHLLTMTSGVAWNEDYGDPQSDVARFSATEAVDGLDPIVVYMRGLKREAEPGTRWQYNTGETNLIGVLVRRATGKPLAEYLSEKVWKPYGMTADAAWLLNEGGHEIGGCCISARLRDYALFGQFVLDGGRVGDGAVVPANWFVDAGKKQAEIGQPGKGYGYQWWTYDDGSFAAQGIFGQGIYIDPARRLVIASNGNWDSASPDDRKQQRDAFYAAVKRALDGEAR